MGSNNDLYADIMAYNSAVTGSCTLVNVRFPDITHVRFLVDCGAFQEKENDWLNGQFEFDPSCIDFVLVTHTHIDHIGRLPLLVKKGFRGSIYISDEAASFLTMPALMDCQAVMESNAKILNKKPIYTEKDVKETMSLIKKVDFFKEWSPEEAKRLKITFFRNAHVPGAAYILVSARYNQHNPINIMFTGDYNDKNNFFCVRELPERVKNMPITIVQESTYGTTDSSACTPRFEEKIAEVAKSGRDILLLAYSFGRTQDILFHLKKMQENGTLSADIPIYLDGKLGIHYTRIYPQLDICERMKNFLPDNFQYVSKGEKENIVKEPNQKIIVTSSGTGQYGPAQFYIPHYLPLKNAYIAFTGYTPVGTRGNALQSAKVGDVFTIGGEDITLQAEIDYFTEFSAHAKADVLLDFLRNFMNINMVLINHGEHNTKCSYAERVSEEIVAKDVDILDRNYFYRINAFGLLRKLPSKFTAFTPKKVERDDPRDELRMLRKANSRKARKKRMKQRLCVAVI